MNDTCICCSTRLYRSLQCDYCRNVMCIDCIRNMYRPNDSVRCGLCENPSIVLMKEYIHMILLNYTKYINYPVMKPVHEYVFKNNWNASRTVQMFRRHRDICMFFSLGQYMMRSNIIRKWYKNVGGLYFLKKYKI